MLTIKSNGMAEARPRPEEKCGIILVNLFLHKATYILHSLKPKGDANFQ
ncbi:MAG: hypothetical protein UW83_C0015G0014 [Parcubacteria group bacterium GW2011_GWD1_44_9]|nr:MAG: hypothetical protein UW83_C0015G0014 [Parcubacteria group bacterium GW2011_GWD1_44_9]